MILSLLNISFNIYNYTNHKKFINLLGYFPKKAEKLLDNISSNLNTDRHLYEFDIIFDDKDIENLFNKTFKFLDEKEIMNIIDSIFKFIVERTWLTQSPSIATIVVA